MASRRDPIKVAEDFASQMRAVFGQDLQAVLLVGSAARGDFIPGKSDVNTLVILSEEGMQWLEKAYPLLQTWRRKKLAIPHFMTAESMRRSLDSYPLEFMDFKLFHKVVLGPDILSDISVPPQALRLQIEREARGKLFLLRQTFAANAGHSRELQAALHRSLSTFTAVCQGILELGKRPVPPARATLFNEAATVCGFSPGVFQQIIELRQGKKDKNLRVIFKDLLREVEKIVSWVDSYKVT